jgi:DnaJ-class molecular chaperone
VECAYCKGTGINDDGVVCEKCDGTGELERVAEGNIKMYKLKI